MRLLMYRGEEGPRPGVLHRGAVIDLPALWLTTESEVVPRNLLDLIDMGQESLYFIDVLLQLRDFSSQDYVWPLEGVELLPPLDPPRGNVLAIGRNYAEHARESA